MAYSFEPFINNDVYSPDQLIAGSFPLVTGNATITAGLTLTRGTVLGIVTATGNYIPSVKTADDGSQNPVAILAEDTDTSEATGTNAATNAPVYLAGEFNSGNMTIDASWTLEQITVALRLVQIFVKTSLSNAIV